MIDEAARHKRVVRAAKNAMDRLGQVVDHDGSRANIALGLSLVELRLVLQLLSAYFPEYLDRPLTEPITLLFEDKARHIAFMKAVREARGSKETYDPLGKDTSKAWFRRETCIDAISVYVSRRARNKTIDDDITRLESEIVQLDGLFKGAADNQEWTLLFVENTAWVTAPDANLRTTYWIEAPKPGKKGDILLYFQYRPDKPLKIDEADFQIIDLELDVYYKWKRPEGTRKMVKRLSMELDYEVESAGVDNNERASDPIIEGFILQLLEKISVDERDLADMHSAIKRSIAFPKLEGVTEQLAYTLSAMDATTPEERRQNVLASPDSKDERARSRRRENPLLDGGVKKYLFWLSFWVNARGMLIDFRVDKGASPSSPFAKFDLPSDIHAFLKATYPDDLFTRTGKLDVETWSVHSGIKLEDCELMQMAWCMAWWLLQGSKPADRKVMPKEVVRFFDHLEQASPIVITSDHLKVFQKEVSGYPKKGRTPRFNFTRLFQKLRVRGE